MKVVCYTLSTHQKCQAENALLTMKCDFHKARPWKKRAVGFVTLPNPSCRPQLRHGGGVGIAELVLALAAGYRAQQMRTESLTLDPYAGRNCGTEQWWVSRSCC